MRHHLTAVRAASTNKSTNNKCWRGCGERETFCTVGGMQTGVVTVGSSRDITKILKMDLPFDPVIPLLGICPKEPKTLILKNMSTPMFIAALFTFAKIRKQPKYSLVDEWIKQLWDIYTMEFYLAVKKKKILPIVTAWMDLENIMLSEISQSEKDQYHMISLI